MKKPSEESSKRPVSKIREIPGLQSTSKLYQDPRFDTARGKADLDEVRKNYAFLDEYRQSEIQTLREQYKKTQSNSARHTIEKAIQSQSSRLDTLKRRDEDKAALKRLGTKKISRRKKKEYLRDERLKSMSKKDAAKSEERRLRKISQKEKKKLPMRRAMDE